MWADAASASMDEEAKRAVLAVLVENAREDVDDIARQTGLAPAAVEDVVAELEAEGVVRGYQAIVDWGRTDADHVTAEVELNVELDRETGYEEIARRIGKYPEVAGLRLVSGDYDFAATVEGDSMNDVSRFVAEKIATIPEVTQTVTHFVMDTYKERGLEFDGGDEDDRLSISP
ncbi:MAG: Lrp/AsnC family transcriptional regulator [Haloferacaceae archaeon]